MKQVLKSIWIASQKNYTLRRFLSFVYYKLSKNKRKIQGENNYVDYKGAFLKKVNIKISGNDNQIIIHKNTRLTNVRITMSGSKHRLEIGENCIINNSGFSLEDSNCEIVIGKQTTIEGALLVSVEPTSKISIGNDCMFSAGIEMRTGDSHSIIDCQTKQRINFPISIEISNHVWIGEKVTVLKGVKIGENSIIGLGSIVTKTIPRNSVAVGIPAKVISDNITWLRERI